MLIEIFSSYIPNIATLAVLAQQETVIIQTGAFYQKQTYRNRTQIAGANGILDLSIPIDHSLKGSKIIDDEVKIAYTEKWQNNHWNSFLSAYNSSPFFEFYRDELEEVFFKEKEKLVDYNLSILLLMMHWLEIESKIIINKKKTIYNSLSNTLITTKQKTPLSFTKYIQVFESKSGFIPNLNALDLLSNLGPESSTYLKQVDINPMLESS